jgi:hypothetical protein
MAVSKTLRFAILQRDKFRCRYCRDTDPDVKLTVDHVVPKALGGTDEASNLVTACQPCNAGKSATSPDAALVADVRADALRHAATMQAAYAVLVERIGLRTDYEDEFEAAYSYGLPDDWRRSIGRWHDMGVPIELITDAAQSVSSMLRTFKGTERFTYFCKVVWNQVAAVDAVTATKAALEGSFYSEDTLSDLDQAAWQRGYAAATDVLFTEADLDTWYCGGYSVGVELARQYPNAPTAAILAIHPYPPEAALTPPTHVASI